MKTLVLGMWSALEAFFVLVTVAWSLSCVRWVRVGECGAVTRGLATFLTSTGSLCCRAFLLHIEVRVLTFPLWPTPARVLSFRSHGFPQTQPWAAAAEQMSSQVCRPPAPHGHPGSHSCVPGVLQNLHPELSTHRPPGSLPAWTRLGNPSEASCFAAESSVFNPVSKSEKKNKTKHEIAPPSLFWEEEFTRDHVDGRIKPTVSKGSRLQWM